MKYYNTLTVSLLFFVLVLAMSPAIACPVDLGPDIETCEGETIVLDGTSPNNGVTYTWFVDGNLISGETNPTLSVTETGLYRVEAIDGTTSCSSEVTVTFNSLPVANGPTELQVCDDDIDGIAVFDLTVIIPEVTGGAQDVTVTFYETQADATTANFAIANATNYSNTVNPQDIFIRVRDDITGCFSITVVTLIVNSIPEIGIPNDIVANDIDGDGIAIFDLTSNDPVLLNGQDPLEFTIAYFETQVDADQGTNAITDPTAYTNMSTPQSIFARVENVGTGCFVTSSFTIEAITFPDEDGDGVPDEDEDVNNNGNLEDDDTDEDGIPNYQDEDDDGDRVDTIDEITGIGAGLTSSYTFIDTDNDTIENYLDDDDDGDMVLTMDEDYNENGTPIDDDTNGNNIPDFLDSQVALLVTEQDFVTFSLFPNPTENILIIEGNGSVEIKNISVYDNLGKLIEEINGNLKIDVSRYDSGIYFLKITGNSKTKTLRFIKK